MSILAHLLARLRLLVSRACTPHDPDGLALREWADLPTHHPRCQ